MDMTSGRPPFPSATGAARLHPADLAALASIGLRTRRLRAALSALGIAIGVAAIVAVLGLSQSSAAGLNAEIARLGTNLLTVTNGQSLSGGTAELPMLERRSEIGLRRALGATRGQIRAQFLAEAILLSLAGGAAGVVLGTASTAVYAHVRGWAIVVPPEAWVGGLAAALLIGAVAGLLPAIRAARMSPTQALWTL